MVAHTFSPSTGEADANLWDTEASTVYTYRTRLAGATGDPISKN